VKVLTKTVSVICIAAVREWAGW